MTPDTHAMWSSAVAEREAAREECRQLRLRVAGLEEVNDRLRGEIRVRDEQIDADRQRIAAYDEQFIASGSRISALETRQQELLQTIVRLTNEVPFPDEIRGWTEQRAKLVAEIGSLRAEVAELSRDPIAADHDSTIAELSSELDQAYTAGAALLADRAALAEHVTHRDLAIDALTRRVAEVMADCDRMQDAAVDVIARLLDEIWRRGEAARRVAAYARTLRTAERVL